MTIKVGRSLLFAVVAAGLLLLHPGSMRSVQGPTVSGNGSTLEPFDAAPFGTVQSAAGADEAIYDL